MCSKLQIWQHCAENETENTRLFHKLLKKICIIKWRNKEENSPGRWFRNPEIFTNSAKILKCAYAWIFLLFRYGCSPWFLCWCHGELGFDNLQVCSTKIENFSPWTRIVHLLFFRENSLLYDERLYGPMNKQRVALVVAHELGHQASSSWISSRIRHDYMIW